MDEKIRRKNMFLTDKIARKAFCVGGLFYAIIFSCSFDFPIARRRKSCPKIIPIETGNILWEIRWHICSYSIC